MEFLFRESMDSGGGFSGAKALRVLADSGASIDGVCYFFVLAA